MKKDHINIYGRKPVAETIRRHPNAVLQVYARETGKGAFFEDLQHFCRDNRIPYHKVPDKKIEHLVGDVNDQGVVASLKEFPYEDFDQWMQDLDMTQNPAVILLDQIQDPHNLGAIIRSAAALGVSAVLLPKNRQVGITATVYKTSAGAVGQLPIIQVGNVHNAIERLKKAGFWVAGLTAEGRTKLWDESFSEPFVLVIGGEGTGLRRQTEDDCDITLAIPMMNEVESLNASVAAALVAYEWRRNQK